MSKTKLALEAIRIEVAQNGEITSLALRLYVENRIGRERFNEVVDQGMMYYNNH